jgi:histidinol phosphatase-like PHP family hydrolase
MQSYFEKIIDFHTHTNLSDGSHNPAEHIRNALVNGYGIIGISDHVDAATLDCILKKTIKLCDETQKFLDNEIYIMANVEITHVPPLQIAELTIRARSLGAELVIVHGETRAESVYPGTNIAAIKAHVDILAHPGFITQEEADLARELDIYLELTHKHGHSITNGHVAQMAKRTGAKLIVSSDAHQGNQMLSNKRIADVCIGAGLTESEMRKVILNSIEIAERVLSK